MAAKAPITTYDTDWLKIKSWANQNKIPTVAVNNVQALDNSRLQNGYQQMSNAQRTRAILAASGMNYNTALPTDNPSASDIWGNTVRNVQGIATGLMPTHLISNIWGTLKTTVRDIEHPNQAGGLSKMLEDTALSWLPGAYDLGRVLDAHSLVGGLENLLQTPITSIIDVMPALKYADLGAGSAVASTATGEALASRLGVTQKALGKMGAVGIVGRRIGDIKIGNELRPKINALGQKVLDSEGNEVMGPMTLSQRLHENAWTHGMGKALSTSAHILMGTGTKFTNEYRKVTTRLVKATGRLSKDYRDEAGVLQKGELSHFNDLLHSGKNIDEILNDSRVTPKIRSAIEEYQKWEDWHKNQLLQSGDLVPLSVQETAEDGSTFTATYLYEATSTVFKQRDRATKALEKAGESSAEPDRVTKQAAGLQDIFDPIHRDLTQLKTNLRTRTTQVVTGLSKGVTDTVGKLIGRDGILDQMEQAYANKDWKTYRDLANKANRLLKSPQFARRLPEHNLDILTQAMQHAVTFGRERAKLATKFERTFAKSKKAVDDAAKAQRAFMDEVRKKPPPIYDDFVKRRFFEEFMKSDKAEQVLDAGAKYLKEEKGMAKAVVDRIRSDPKRLYDLVVAVAGPTFRDPFLPQMTSGEAAHFMNTALKEVESLRARGYQPMYVPNVSIDQAGRHLMDDRVYVKPMKFPTIKSARDRAFDGATTVNDVMLGVSRATKEVLERDATLEFASRVIVPMLRAETALKAGIVKHNPYASEIAESAVKPLGTMKNVIEKDFGLKEFKVNQLIDLSPEDLGLDPEERYYIPKDLADGLQKLVGRDQFPVHGIWDKATGIFKYSILGLSPRYTAHVLFGGGMMLALRIDPRSFALIGHAAKMVNAYHRGEDLGKAAEVFQGEVQRGSPDVAYHHYSGRRIGILHLEDWLHSHGINPKFATVADKAAAAADINFRFTRYIGDMQRAVAYLDGIAKAERRGWLEDPVTGERVEMTGDRAHFLGMQSTERVMGNLQAMTPFERSVARKIMPFYGWTKHVLKYVMTYPFDHPWRAMFLATLAEQNSERFASGLDERMQLLFFLGSPDSSGNVKAVDIRQIDPFRDVANYATFSGWFSALNPLLTAVPGMVDPELIYGSNVKYPTITYNSVYGTTTAGPSGGFINAAEAEIPEIGALDQLLGLSAQARAAKKAGGTTGLKNLMASLGIPWTVQDLNLQQISAKHEIDRYDQAKQDALNAWQSGDFSVIDKYPKDAQLPDPLQSGYNITPAALKAQYAAAKKKYPNLPPSEVIASLPAPRL